MKVTQRQLKQIIREEIDKTLKEQVPNGYKDPGADGRDRREPGDGEDRREKGPGQTRGEEEMLEPLRNTQEWAKQLTPVIYRQFLEDVKRMATEAERQSQKSGGRGWIKCSGGQSLNGAKNAMGIAQSYATKAMAGKVTAQGAANFEDTFQKCEVLGAPVIDSGYPGLHGA